MIFKECMGFSILPSKAPGPQDGSRTFFHKESRLTTEAAFFNFDISITNHNYSLLDGGRSCRLVSFQPNLNIGFR